VVGDEFPCLYTLVAALAVSGLPSPREGIEEIRFLPFDPVRPFSIRFINYHMFHRSHTEK
jgi:hypothetical protein